MSAPAHIDGRPVIDRDGIRALTGKSASSVTRYIATAAPGGAPGAGDRSAQAPPLPRFPAKAGTLEREGGRPAEVWFTDEVTAWWRAYRDAIAERRTLVDRIGDPEELVDLEEAAIVCGYDDGRTVTSLLGNPASNFPPPDLVEPAGGRPRMFYRRHTLWEYCQRRGLRGRPRGAGPYDPLTVQAAIEHLRTALESEPPPTVTADTLAAAVELDSTDRFVRKGYLIRAARVVIPERGLITRADIAARVSAPDAERARQRVMNLMKRPDAPTPVLQDRRVLYYRPEDIEAFLHRHPEANEPLATRTRRT